MPIEKSHRRQEQEKKCCNVVPEKVEGYKAQVDGSALDKLGVALESEGRP